MVAESGGDQEAAGLGEHIQQGMGRGARPPRAGDGVTVAGGSPDGGMRIEEASASKHDRNRSLLQGVLIITESNFKVS